jgi:hypothetical protein
MQAFSGMQRVGTDSRTLIRYLLLLIPLVIYESLSTVYYLLPPLFGVMTALLVAHRAERYLPLVLIYLLFFEADHGLFVFSSWIFLLLFFRFVLPVLEENLICRPCILALSVILSYLGYALFMSLIWVVFNLEGLDFNLWLLFYFIAIETMIAVLLL